MGFQKQWINHLTGKPKLSEDEFTTFRFPRKDKDWEVGEVVQIVLKPRTKERIPLGEALIVSKEPRSDSLATGFCDGEAQRDGFHSAIELIDFLTKGKPSCGLHPNRLTLRWTRRYDVK